VLLGSLLTVPFSVRSHCSLYVLLCSIKLLLALFKAILILFPVHFRFIKKNNQKKFKILDNEISSFLSVYLLYLSFFHTTKKKNIFFCFTTLHFITPLQYKNPFFPFFHVFLIILGLSFFSQLHLFYFRLATTS